MKSRLLTTLCAGMLILNFVTQANAAVIYDETIAGDFANNDFPLTSLGALLPGTNSILGSLDAGLTSSTLGDGPDELDVFSFTSSSAWSLDLVSLSGTMQNGMFAMFLHTWPSPTLIDVSVISLATTGVFNQPAGTYELSLVPGGNMGTANYQIDIQVAAVPVPAAAWLLGSGLLGLVGVSRTRRG